MNGQLSDFLLSRFTICFTLCKLFHFACQISFDMAIWLLQLGQFCCERFFICSAVERTNALTSHTKLERWTYSRGPVKGERGAHVPCRDFKTHLWGFWGESHIPVGILLLYIAISRKVVGKNAHSTIPNGHMGYDQYTVLESLAVALLLLLSFGTHKHTSIPTRAILSNFFGEQWTENHPRYLSGLSRALFPTTFLEIAVYNLHFSTSVLPFQHIFVSFVTILTVYTSLSRHVHLSPRNHWFSCEMMATEHVHNWQPTLPTTDWIITHFWETAHLPVP